VISIRWSTRAADEFEALINHINEDNPEAALSMAQNVLNRIAQIQAFPNIGRPGERPGTRELVVAPFVVVYWLLTEDDAEILRVWHGAQNWRQATRTT
jgi:plasmid stabilization system protein ParE